MKWYLAGPIGFVKDNSDREWRNKAKEQLDYIDPFEQEVIGGLDNGEICPKDLMNKYREEHQWNKVHEYMTKVLEIDKESVNSSDGLLVYSPHPSWGTIRECTLAYEQKKPIVIFTGNDKTKDNMSNTMLGITKYIFKTLDEAINMCKTIENGEK